MFLGTYAHRFDTYAHRFDGGRIGIVPPTGLRDRDARNPTEREDTVSALSEEVPPGLL